MLGNFLIAAALVMVMVIATGVAIHQFEKVAIDWKVRKLLLASILIGLSTSLPELFITTSSALTGQMQIALGDLLGANIANLSWVIGGAAVIGRAVPVVGEYIRDDLWITMILAMAPIFLMMDGSLSRFDGLILIFGYSLYLNDLIVRGRYKIRQAKINKQKVSKYHKWALKSKVIHFLQMLLILGILGFAATKLIEVTVEIAGDLGVNKFFIGLVVVAIATTLPEVVVSIEAVRRKQASLVLGNLLGSVIVNSTLIMGIGAIIRPIIFEENLTKGVTGIFTVAILGLFWLFTKTKRRLDRWEGVVLVGVYLMFLGLQFLILK